MFYGYTPIYTERVCFACELGVFFCFFGNLKRQVLLADCRVTALIWNKLEVMYVNVIYGNKRNKI